jgi:tRNA 2-thiouridine synthesizing protein A
MTTELKLDEAQVLDVRGLSCPMPVVRTAKAMKTLEAGQILKIMATDRGSLADMPAWAHSTGNTLLESREEGDTFVFFVRKEKEA